MISIKSKFTNRAFFIPVMIVVFTAISAGIIYSNFPLNVKMLRWIDIYTGFIFIITILWLVCGELKQKMIIIEIKNNHISKRNYLGQFNEFNFKDFEGYETSIISSKNGKFEYLYLIKDGQKKIKISEQYHRNYVELKTAIGERTPFLRDINFSIWQEFKELFSF